MRLVREPRRLAAILLLGLSGGIVLAFLVARGDLAGADARVYWVAVRLWLGGGDMFYPPEPFIAHAYAPWTLYPFLPFAMLPADTAWFLWRAAYIGGFALTVAWAYERRPLATAILFAVLAPWLAATLDTGNINLAIIFGVWAAWFVRPGLGGLLWALGAALKWVPVALLFFIPRPARPWGLLWLAVLAVLTFATWPEVLRQIDVVFNLPRPLRVDYFILVWAAVPWLWHQPWPPDWLRAAGARRLLAEMRAQPATFLRTVLGLPAGSADTSTRGAVDRH